MTGYFSGISGQNSRQLTEAGSGELWLSVFLYLGPVLILAAGCTGCALLTWHFFAGNSEKRKFWYGIGVAVFFLLGAVRCQEAMELPVLWGADVQKAGSQSTDSQSTDSQSADGQSAGGQSADHQSMDSQSTGRQKWELEQLNGEWIQGKGILEQVTEKEGTVIFLIRQVHLQEPCQGDMGCKLYVTVEMEDGGLSYQNSRPGQIICFQGTFSRYSEATNPGAFDYGEYCWSLGIGGQIEANADQIQLLGKGSMVRYGLQKLRFFLRERLLQLAQPSDAGILICLLTGDKSELDAYWKELYEEASILHLLSLSGLHVGILGMGLFRLLRKLMGSFFWSSLFSGVFMVAFCVMTGSGTSMVRAMICFLLFLLAGYTGRSYDLSTASSVAGILLLLEHPLLLFQAGFLMTFSCVMGIGFLLPLGELIFVEDDEAEEVKKHSLKVDSSKEHSSKEHSLKGNTIKENFLKKVLRKGGSLNIEKLQGTVLNESAMKSKIQKSLLSAALLQLSSLPAVLWFQGAASLAGPFINLLTVPLMNFVLISDVLAVAASLISMKMGIFLLGPAHYILSWYEKVCLFFYEMPFLRIVTGRPYGWQIFLWLVILAGILLFGYRQVLWKHKKLPFLLGVLLFPCTILFLQRTPSHNLNIHFLDVGQGDGIVMELPEGQGVFCIDGGSSSQTKLKEYVYEPYFSFAGIAKVDGWLITHPDSDHYSGMLSLLEDGFKIEHIFMAEQFRESELAEQIEAFQSIEYITAGNAMQMGDLQFEFLHPGADYSSTDANDESAVVYVTWNDFSALFTGDISEDAETEVLQNLNGRQVDLLKASHHGSKTASSQEFLDGIFGQSQKGALAADSTEDGFQTQTAVISCGANNRYGHPHQEVLERLENLGIAVYRTDQSGCIQVVSQGEDGYQVYPFLKG